MTFYCPYWCVRTWTGMSLEQVVTVLKAEVARITKVSEAGNLPFPSCISGAELGIIDLDASSWV